MAFIDKVLRWKKKPFKKAEDISDASKKGKGSKAAKVSENSNEKGSGAYSHVLTRPHISEKSSMLQEKRQYVFEVSPSTTKHDVALAIADLYKVVPTAVNMVQVRGKQIRFGRTEGSTRGWKKAIITLPEGKSIDTYKK